MKKQKNDKNIDNNKRIENSFKMKKYKSEYYVTDQNVNYYNVEGYNQKNKKLKVNFVTAAIIYCYNYH